MYKLTKKKVRRELKKQVSARSNAIQKADRAFSLYIRTRDAQEFYGKAFRCISCGRCLPIEQADCGHYINRRHLATRFSEMNCNAQCRCCNRFDEGNIYGYRKGLYTKIGEDNLEKLEAAKNQTLKLSVFELQEIAKMYTEKTKEFAYQIK